MLLHRRAKCPSLARCALIDRKRDLIEGSAEYRFNLRQLRQFASKRIPTEPKHLFIFNRLPAAWLVQKIIYGVVYLDSFPARHVLLQFDQLRSHPRVELGLLGSKESVTGSGKNSSGPRRDGRNAIALFHSVREVPKLAVMTIRVCFRWRKKGRRHMTLDAQPHDLRVHRARRPRCGAADVLILPRNISPQKCHKEHCSDAAAGTPPRMDRFGL